MYRHLSDGLAGHRSRSSPCLNEGVDNPECEQRRRKAQRLIATVLTIEFTGGGATGLGVGLSQHSVGWGLAGALLFGVACVVVGVAGVPIVGGRKAMRQIVQLFRQRRPRAN